MCSRVLLVLLVGAGGGCLPVGGTVPLDHPVFPTGLALQPDGSHLAVVSSDFNLAFDDGALLLADLAAVRAATAGGDAGTVVKGAYASAAVLPPFGDKPVFDSGGDRLIVPTRGSNLVNTIAVADGALVCGRVDTAAVPPRCGSAPVALQLSENDPFDVLLTRELHDDAGAVTRVDGIVTLLSSHLVSFFSDDPTQARPMQLRGSLDLGATIGGVRASVLRPRVAGSAPVVIAAADTSTQTTTATLTSTVVGAVLLLFQPRADAAIKSFDVTAATGAVSMRDVVLVPGADGENDAVVAVLRGPDGLARFEIDDGGAVPEVHMSALAETCRGPTSLALAHRPQPRVLVTCQVGDVIQAVDPVSLAPLDAVRFAGRGPYDVVVNDAADPPEAFVSFFLDDSVGVLHLTDGTVDAAGNPVAKLVVRGRIGAQSDKPEDGRQ